MAGLSKAEQRRIRRQKGYIELDGHKISQARNPRTQVGILTPRQTKYYEYFKKLGNVPTYEELQLYFNVKPPTIYHLLKSLEHWGYIKKNGRGYAVIKKDPPYLRMDPKFKAEPREAPAQPISSLPSSPERCSNE